jgi:DNA-binding transcriptional regulator PaaX
MKYKYYFKKPKSEIAKDIIYWLAVSGLVCFAATSPYFIRNLLKAVPKWKKYKKRKISSTFKKLLDQGCINIRYENGQIYISLTEKGKKMAGWMQIDSLKIKRPKKWDGKWRIVIFDISQLKKSYREAFRGKLKELGFIQLQKSVWVHAFDCKDEIELLRDFFGLSHKELRLIVSEDIGPDDWIRRTFRL